jgi:hypothetical protein
MASMIELKRCLANDLRGINLEEHADLEGFIVRDLDGMALYTAYCSPDGYSSYIAINDHRKGIECADEKPLALNAPLFTAVAKIKADHFRHSPQLYPRTMETWEAVQNGIFN